MSAPYKSIQELADFVNGTANRPGGLCAALILLFARVKCHDEDKQDVLAWTSDYLDGLVPLPTAAGIPKSSKRRNK